jgi:hypothetical protein
MKKMYVTDMEMLLQCPKLYFKRRIQGEKIDMNSPRAYPLIIGNIFHASRQSKDFAYRMLRSYRLPLKENMEAKMLIESAPHDIDKEMKDFVYEQGFSYVDENVNIRGRIDKAGYIDKQLHLIDFKTAKVAYDENIVWDMMHQWYIYPAMACIEMKIPEDEYISFSYIVYKKSASNFLPPVAITKKMKAKEYCDLFVSNLKKCIMTLALEHFPADPDTDKRCLSCEYRRECFAARTLL